MNRLKLSLSSKLMLTGICLVVAIALLLAYALTHPTASSPFPAIVMKLGMIAILAIGVGLILLSTIMKIRNIFRR
jgi:protein-S-isoprenylcysteine O-methyltransferase Ste14